MYDGLIEEYTGQFGKGRSIEDVVDCVEELPPMPDVTAQALRLVDDPNTSAEEISDVIKRDPALAAAILRSANSAAMGQEQEVKTLDTAIMIIGIGQLKSRLLASALRRWNRQFGPIEKLVWEKSLGAACASQALCLHLERRDRDEFYLTALLHNLGQIVLLSHKQLGPLYRAVVNRIYELHEDFITAEREVIGFSHPLVGALVAKKWGFPVPLCQVILRYADPFEGVGPGDDEKVGLLKLTVGLSMEAGFGCPEGYTVNTEELQALALTLGFEEATFASSWQKIVDYTKTRFAAEAGTYN
jgi:HD-like signal output (HDOD) protein